MKWENNGPGWDLGRLLVHDFNYPFYYRSETIGKVGVKKTDKYGYHMSRESKEFLLRAYERALKQGKIINHDEQSLEQAKYYIYLPDGGVGPADLTDKKAAERLMHGDRVMSDALATEDKDVAAKPKYEGPAAPFRSFEWRFRRFKKSKQKPKGWRKKFSFA